MSAISRSVSESFVSMARGEREFGCTAGGLHMSLRGVRCLENIILFTLLHLLFGARNPHGILTAPYPAFLPKTRGRP